MSPLLQLTRSGTKIVASAGALAAARETFARHHGVRLEGFLEPALLASIQRGVASAQFDVRVHDRLDPPVVDLCMAPNATMGLLAFLANDALLFDVARQLTRCPPIGCFVGTVYRMMPRRGHVDVWHSDVGEDRLVGLSVNLSEDVYQGGVLQIKDCGTGRIACELPNLVPGDAILFRIDEGLKHRLSELDGSVPKTSFAGWFCARPSYRDFLRAQLERTRSAQS